MASDPITPEGQKQLLVEPSLNTFRQEGWMFIGALTLIMVKILPAQSICVFDANPWQFQGSGKDRRQNRDGMVTDGS